MTAVRRVDRRTAVVRLRGAEAKADSAPPSPDAIQARIDPVTGFLIVDGRVSRGNVVQQYSDGETTWGELRRVEDVYDEAALASMSPRPIVDSAHTWVDSDNWAATSKGMTGAPRVDETTGWCTQQLAIADRAMIAQVVDGEAIEISLGYECNLVPEEGELDGVPYSYRQTDVRVNHAALGPRDWARAGNDACLIFDSTGSAGEPVGVQVIEGDPIVKNKKTKNKNKSRDTKARAATPRHTVKDGKLMIGEAEYEVDDEVLAYFERLIAEKESAAEESEDMESEETMDEDMEIEVEEKSDAKIRDRLEAIQDSFRRYREEEASRVDARARLFADAREILGRHANLDGLPAIEIHRQVIDKLLGSRAPKLDGRSAEYIQATYDNALALHRDAHSLTRAIGRSQIHGDSNKTTSLDSLQADMMARMSGRKAS